MTRKRFLKLNRALAARSGFPVFGKLAAAVKIPSTVPVSYAELWFPNLQLADLYGIRTRLNDLPVGGSHVRKLLAGKAVQDALQKENSHGR